MRRLTRPPGNRLASSSSAVIVILTLALTHSVAQSVPPTQAIAHPSPPKAPALRSPYSYANEQSALSRTGDVDATRALTHHLFQNASIPVEIADAFGFTDRIAGAEAAYRKGGHASVSEEQVVTAVNNFSNTLSAPTWTHTTQSEVRKLRVRLCVVLPQLFVNHGPPDAKGHYQLLSPEMSPLEASYIATTMLYMKVFDSDFQFTDSERAQSQYKDPVALLAAHGQRESLMLDIVQGRSKAVSVADLMAASDHLFNDLGVPQDANSARKTLPLLFKGLVTTKGAL